MNRAQEGNNSNLSPGDELGEMKPCWRQRETKWRVVLIVNRNIEQAMETAQLVKSLPFKHDNLS